MNAGVETPGRLPGSGLQVSGPFGCRAGAPSREGAEVEAEHGCENGRRHVLGELDQGGSPCGRLGIPCSARRRASALPVM